MTGVFRGQLPGKAKRAPSSKRGGAVDLAGARRRAKDPLRYERGVLAGMVHDPKTLARLNSAGIYTIPDLEAAKHGHDR